MVGNLTAVNPRNMAAMLVLTAFIVLRTTGCGSGPTDPSDTDMHKKFKNPVSTPGPLSTGTVEPAVISPTAGYILDETEFDLLQTMSNPLTNEQWDLIFGSHTGGAVDRTGNDGPKKSWYYSSPTEQCAFEVTVAITYRSNESHADEHADDGTYAYSRWAFGSEHGASSLAPKDEATVDCFFGPRDRETSIAGVNIIEYRVAWKRIAGTCEFDAPINVEYEVFYKSRVFSNAIYGESCPGLERIANCFAADRAQAVANGKNLFASSAGTQSGDDILPSLTWDMGGGTGVTSPVTMASGDMVTKEEGTIDLPNQGVAEAFINGFGKDSDTGFTGYVLLSSGCKVHAEQDSRACAAASVSTRTMGLYGVIDVGGTSTYFYWYGGADATQVSKDATDLMRPFFAMRGYPDVPPPK
jgi:hypothetical protein